MNKFQSTAIILMLMTAPALASTIEVRPFHEAAFSFAVTDLTLDGNKVSFVVPEDAREMDSKADAVVISGLYLLDEAKPEKCPMVHSTEVKKDIQDYNPFNGRAKIIATFTDPEMAKAAVETGCLLVNDPPDE